MALVLFEHIPPTWVIGLALASAVLLGLFWFWRYLHISGTTIVLALLRVGFFAVLGWCLLLPLRKQESSTAIKPRFLMLVDASQSMQTVPPAGPGATSRWAVASNVITQSWTTHISQEAALETFTFAADLDSVGAPSDVLQRKPDGSTTRLRDSLRKAIDRYRGQKLAGILLLSDGIDTRAGGTERVNSSWPCPIYTVRLEPVVPWQVAPDVRVNRVETPRRVIVGWDSKLTASISGEGTRGQVLNVQLFENERLLGEQPTQLPAEGGTREVVFTVPHATIGNYTYRVNLPPLPGEVATNDNAYAVAVQVVDTKNRLVYIEGPPRFESKFLTRALEANPTVTPLVFLQGANGKWFSVGQRNAMTTALTPEQLTQYKIVILGDLDADALGADRANALVKFVEDGGSLVLLGGPKAWGVTGFAATPLKKLLPVSRPDALPTQEGKFAVTWTAEGRAHPAFAQNAAAWEHAPPVLTIFPGSHLSAGAVALATTGQGDPLVAAARFGQGKVAAVLTDSLWRWRLEPGAEDMYDRFWTQLLEWMSPKETELAEYELDLFAETDQLLLGDKLNLLARLGARENNAARPSAVTCRIQTPDGRPLTFPMTAQQVTTSAGKAFPGYGTEFTAETPGLHTAVAIAEINGKKVESAPYSFYLKPFTPESNPRPANAELLAALAQTSGGRYLDPTEVNAVLGNLKVEGSAESRVQFSSLWDRWPVLAGLLALLTIEWAVRKAKNLP